MDSLDDILTPPEHPADVLLPVVEQLKTAVLAQPLGSLSLATPEDRRAVVQLHETLVDLNSLIRARIQGIDMMVKRAFSESRVRRLYYDEHAAPIGYEPEPNAYVVDDPEKLRQELGRLVPDTLTHEEVDEAVHPEVYWKLNQAKLNTLARRGEAVEQIINAHRTVREKDPLGGSLKWPAAPR